MRNTVKIKGSVQKRIHVAESMSKVNLSLPSNWQKIKKIILEKHSPFHDHRS